DPDDDRIREIQQGIDIAKEKLKEYNDIDQAESIKFVISKNISEDDINKNKFFEIKKGIISSRNKTTKILVPKLLTMTKEIVNYIAIDEFLKYLTETIKFLEENRRLESYLSLEHKNIHKDIIVLQNNINNLENFHLREEFG
ncbi:23726_t:CDS:2, partial [Gigaspora rosea]